MIASFFQQMASSLLAADGRKNINRDSDNVGSDDVKGRVELAAASAISALDLSTLSAETLNNTATALESAAAQLRATANTI